MKQLALLLPVAFLLIVGCGEDEKNFTRVDERVGFEVAANLDGLGKCDSQHVAALTFVKDSSKVFFCDGSHWVSVDGKNGKDGTDGKDGKQGVDGKSGSICTATKEGSLHTIVCGYDTVTVDTRVKTPSTCKTTENEDGSTTLTCGDKSATTIVGKDGGDGEPCTFIDNGDFTMTMACGEVNVLLYGDICGDSLFNPEELFCNGVKLYPKCSGLVYDPKYQDCTDEGIVIEYCGTGYVPYDPTKQTCNYGVVRDLCGGQVLDSRTEFCYNGKIFLYCENEIGVEYDGDAYHCEGGRIVGSVMDRDSNVYRTLVIDGTEWMAENYRLNVEGSLCPSEFAEANPYSEGVTSYGNPNVAQSNYEKALGVDCSKDGRTYNWAMIMDIDAKYLFELAGDLIKENHQGICPDGWHIPTLAELETLKNSFALKDAVWKTEFNRHPTGGFNFTNGKVADYYKGTYLVSSTENEDEPGYGRWLSLGDAKTSTSDGKADYDAMRCVKNKVLVVEGAE